MTGPSNNPAGAPAVDAKESAMERAGEVWSYPQARAASNTALAARVVDLERELAQARRECAVSSVQPDIARDTARLDFTLDNLAFICATGEARFQLMTQDEDEEYRILSARGEYFTTKRAAVDSAMAAQQGGQP